MKYQNPIKPLEVALILTCAALAGCLAAILLAFVGEMVWELILQ